MKKARRVVAFLALLAVGWAALWPLVSAAHAQAAGAPMPLCHQAGGMVPMDDVPQAPAPPGERKEHCPLCIMAFYGAFGAPLHAPAFFFSCFSVALDTHCAPRPHGVEVALPFGRAPPASPLA